MGVLPRAGDGGSGEDWKPANALAAAIAIAKGRAAGLNAYPKQGFIPPNFVKGYVAESRGDQIVVLCFVTMSLCFVVACTRVVTRRIVTGRLHMDDWMIIPATIFAGILSALSIYSVWYGALGQHRWDIKSIDQAAMSVRLTVPPLLCYMISVFFTKLSVLCFVRRLAGISCSVGLKRVLNAFIVFHIAFTIALSFVTVFQCLPLRVNFDLMWRFHPDARCKNYFSYYYIAGSIHAASDLAVMALPIYMVMGLRMGWQQKAATIFMFIIGGLACIFSIIRMTYAPIFAYSYDLSWDSFYAVIYGQLEATLAIIACSLPALRTFFGRVLPDLLLAPRDDSGNHSRLTKLRRWARHQPPLPVTTATTNSYASDCNYNSAAELVEMEEPEKGQATVEIAREMRAKDSVLCAVRPGQSVHLRIDR